MQPKKHIFFIFWFENLLTISWPLLGFVNVGPGRGGLEEGHALRVIHTLSEPSTTAKKGVIDIRSFLQYQPHLP